MTTQTRYHTDKANPAKLLLQLLLQTHVQAQARRAQWSTGLCSVRFVIL